MYERSLDIFTIVPGHGVALVGVAEAKVDLDVGGAAAGHQFDGLKLAVAAVVELVHRLRAPPEHRIWGGLNESPFQK
jgi:hypothetical protein